VRPTVKEQNGLQPQVVCRTLQEAPAGIAAAGKEPVVSLKTWCRRIPISASRVRCEPNFWFHANRSNTYDVSSERRHAVISPLPKRPT